MHHPARCSVSDILHKSRRTGGSLPRYSTLRAFLWRKVRPPVWLIRRLRREQLGVVDAVNEHLAGSGFTLLKGIEVDIHLDGTLDQDDDLLARLDLRVASVHSKLRMPAGPMTRRM